MERKTWLLIAGTLVLAAVYLAGFTNWFQPQTVRIFHTSRDLRPAARTGALPNLMFGLDRPLRLTEIRIVPLAAYQTNQNTLPLWHLVSDSNSAPVKTFFYGQFIRGLKPAVPGTRPQALTNNVTYHLLLTAGKIHGGHDFEWK